MVGLRRNKTKHVSGTVSEKKYVFIVSLCLKVKSKDCEKMFNLLRRELFILLGSGAPVSGRV